VEFAKPVFQENVISGHEATVAEQRISSNPFDIYSKRER